jgi:hypothetical protein
MFQLVHAYLNCSSMCRIIVWTASIAFKADQSILVLSVSVYSEKRGERSRIKTTRHWRFAFTSHYGAPGFGVDRDITAESSTRIRGRCGSG